MSGRSAIAAAGYAAVMALVIYGVLEPSWDDAFPYVYGPLAVIHVVAGFAAARWWAVLLPLMPLLISLPAGYPESRYEPLPVAALFILFAPAWALFTAAGVWLGRARGRSARSHPG